MAQKLGRGFVVVAVDMDEEPPKVATFVRENQLSYPVLLGGGQIAVAYGVASTPGSFLLDGNGVVRMKQIGYAGDFIERAEKKVQLIEGALPVEYGWRRDVARSFTDAVQKINDGDHEGAEKLLQSMVPPNPLRVFIDTSAIPSAQRNAYVSAVTSGLSVWNRLTRNLVEIAPTQDEREANVTLKFASQVYDPADQYGDRTVCASMRALNQGESRFRVTATLAIGHASTGITHNAAAIAHLTADVIGYTLGLDHQPNDPDSILNPSVDEPEKITLTPSPDDLTILSNYLGNVFYRLGMAQVALKENTKAEDSFRKVLLIFPDSKPVRTALAEIKSSRRNE